MELRTNRPNKFVDAYQEGTVPRFYFDVRDDGNIIPDDEGSEFESLDAAVHAAACSTAEIGTDRLAKGDTRAVVLEVRDDQGQRVCTVTASMKIERHELSSQPSDLGQA
jgi:hypothetical protein